MQLPKSEADHFFRLFKPLLIYTNQQFQITPGMKHPEDIEGYPFEETVKVRDTLGKTKVDVEGTIKQILPQSQRKFVYYFHLKGK